MRVIERTAGALLAAQPLVIVVQLVVAGQWRGDFSLIHNTISDLGAVGCLTRQTAHGSVAGCSPWHALLNGSFVVLGSALALAGLALMGRRGVRLAGALLVVAGVGSALVGLVPLDVDPGLHALVATPVFVSQPLAVLLVARGVRKVNARLALVLLVLGLLAEAGAVGFGVTVVVGQSGGGYERLALWTCHLAWGVVGLALVRGRLWEDGGVRTRR